MAEQTKDIQEKFVLYQLLNQRLEEIKQHATMIQHKMIEFETSRLALSEMRSVKPESEILIPVGSGIYTFGKSSAPENVLIDLGAGVVAKKTMEEAAAHIDKKRKEIEDAAQMLQGEANAITAKLQEIVPELQKAAEAQNAAGAS